MWRGVFLACLVLCACESGSRHFADVPVTRVSVGGSDFDVRVRGELAEAVRRNAQYAPRMGPMRARAALAMQRVSGCKVEYVLGDQAVALGLLDCDGQSRDWHLWLRDNAFDCVEARGLSDTGPGGPYYDYDCTRF